jgi:hypothetical protein
MQLKMVSGDYPVNALVSHNVGLGLAKTINIRCIYGIFGGEITKYTVMYGVYIRSWLTLSRIHTYSLWECALLFGRTAMEECGL